MLTEKWIDEQLKLCEAASQGPWRDGFDDGSGRIGDYEGAWIVLDKQQVCESYMRAQQDLAECVIWGGDYEGIPIGVLKQEDVDFIIAARESYSVVLKEIQRLRLLCAETHSIVQCPCCGELYLEGQGDGDVCLECGRMQSAFIS